MTTISPIEIFLALFIGMGPIKVLLVYIAMTEGMRVEVKRQVAKRTVLVAGAVGLGLFLLGAILQAILHFSIGSLTIFGGLILLILALTMVIGGQKTTKEGQAEVDPMSIADRSSRMDLMVNEDGSIDLYFGPDAPAGKEANWIPTVAGKAWFPYFRLYSPQQAFLDKSWILPDIEKA